MCGIAGVLSREADALAPIRAMSDALRHRGPDDEGYLFANVERARVWRFSGADTAAGVPHPRLTTVPEGASLVLANRRLAILDPTPAGHGPMGTRDGRLWVTYNGEIFNYVELRDELAALGHRFLTGTDTEVLLAAWTEWGQGALPRLNGMFAFALYDSGARRLFCVRDRFGVKPFHYSWDGARFVFASEIKGLLAHPAVPCRSHVATELAFLVSGALDEGAQTFFEGIHRLPAGHLLALDLDRPAVEPKRWYSLPREAPRAPGDGELRGLLEDAIRLRLRSDVPVGTCLSGGLDSSTIVTLMHEMHEGPISCFSVLYDDRELTERPFVDALVRQIPVDAHVTVPDGLDMHETLRAIVWHNDQPSNSMGQYSQWHAMKLAAAHGVVVLLNGQGGDELLGGYDRYISTGVRALALSGHPVRARRLAQSFGAVRGVAASLYGKQALYSLFPGALTTLRHRISPVFTPARLAGARLLRGPESHAAKPFRSLRAHLVADLTELSVPSLVHGEDRCSMAFSREIRLPFLDHRLAEMLLDVPQDLKLRGGETKYLLRQAMTGRLPETVRRRSDKKGYPTPVGRWLRTCGLQEARAVIHSPELLARGFLDPAEVQRLFREHSEARADHGLLLWQCLGLEYWARTFLDRSAA